MPKTLPERFPATHLVTEQSFNLRLELAGEHEAYAYVNDRYLGRARIVDQRGTRKIQFRNGSAPYSNYVRLNNPSDYSERFVIEPHDTMASLLNQTFIVNRLLRCVVDHVLSGRLGYVEHMPLAQDAEAA